MKKIILTAVFFTLLAGNSFCGEAGKERAAPEINESSGAVSGPAPEVLKVVEKLKEWDAKLESLKSDFSQEVDFTNAGIKQKVEGTLSYKKKDRLRIEHLKPSRQLIITDKRDIFIYKVEDELVYKTSWDYWKKTQDQNLSGILDMGNYSELAEKNEIKVTETPEGIKAEFTSKNNPGVYLLTLTLSATDYFPYEASLRVDKTLITTKLTKTEINGELDDKLFKFVKPKKAELIEIKRK
ncbi:MAG: hypothetical protein COT17_05370 [Elusimicrobia bacterium CG08_land_8_20_14_0_20_51_18]|nr:MAG: hypothetical protein COT17_05370 [Elusimicrobia bacterium CG08_land_8_20_14_0_20_51_18]